MLKSEEYIIKKALSLKHTEIYNRFKSKDASFGSALNHSFLSILLLPEFVLCISTTKQGKVFLQVASMNHEYDLNLKKKS